MPSTYGYDTLNRLNGLANSWAGSFGFSYDALSRRTQLTRPNGITTNYNYDSLSHLLSVLHQAGTNILDGASYTYDLAGNRTSKGNYLNGVTSNYTYDPLYQLTQVTQGTSTTESYSYDAVGNRLSSSGVPNYSYNSSNELTSNSTGSYTYDANGNTLSDPQGRSFTWDFENRLTQAIVPGSNGGTTTFKYDPFGRRIQKSGPLGTTNYLYEGVNPLEEVDAGGNQSARYTQEPRVDSALALSGGSTAYYETDGQNSITTLSDPSGALLATYTFDSFGSLTASTGSSNNSLRYSGRQFDLDTGLYYYRARYYQPSAGRFVSEDPLGFSGDDVDFYSYVGNAPIDFVDPFGLGRVNSPRRGPPNTDVYIPDPTNPDGGTVRVYGPNGDAVTDYDFGHDHTGDGDPHAHDWNPTRGRPRPVRPTECSRVRDDYWRNFWNAFYLSYSDHMVRVWENTQRDFSDFTWGLEYPRTPSPATSPFGPTGVPPYVYSIP